MTYPAPQLSVCPRHPDRESYVLCQRCGRPACPQCQVQAAVGVQCVDCVREGAATVRSARTRAGAVVRDSRPVVTFGFIGACIAAFLMQLTIPNFTARFAFIPIIGMDEPWRYLTTAFLHDSSSVLSLHLLMNMYCMWALGQGLEPQLGRLRYLAVLVLTAFGGSVAYQLLVGRDSLTFLIGASGIVFGLFGVLLTAGRAFGLDIRGIVAVIAINAVLGFMLPGIAWQGHLGGFVVGCLLGLLFTAGSGTSVLANRSTRGGPPAGPVVGASRNVLQAVGCLAILFALVLAAFFG